MCGGNILWAVIFNDIHVFGVLDQIIHHHCVPIMAAWT